MPEKTPAAVPGNTPEEKEREGICEAFFAMAEEEMVSVLARGKEASAEEAQLEKEIETLDSLEKILETAGQGGAWGIALLAAYMLEHKEGETLSEYLDQRIFAGTESAEASPDSEDVEGFAGFMEYFRKGLPIERAAVESL